MNVGIDIEAARARMRQLRDMAIDVLTIEVISLLVGTDIIDDDTLLTLEDAARQVLTGNDIDLSPWDTGGGNE